MHIARLLKLSLFHQIRWFFSFLLVNSILSAVSEFFKFWWDVGLFLDLNSFLFHAVFRNYGKNIFLGRFPCKFRKIWKIRFPQEIHFTSAYFMHARQYSSCNSSILSNACVLLCSSSPRIVNGGIASDRIFQKIRKFVNS